MTLRVPTDEDVDEIARIMSQHWPEPADADLVRRQWSAPGFDRERDARVEPGGYAYVDGLDEARVWINLRGSPSPELVDWAEQRARERGGRIWSGTWIGHDAVLDALRGRGYVVLRHSFRMKRDLDAEVPEPTWPGGMRVRTFRAGDERRFYETGHEAFADTWEPTNTSYEEWLHWAVDSPSFDADLWFLAEEGPDAAGFAICKIHPGDPELGWVQILGVRAPWRGRGIGRALLLTSFRAFRDRGLRVAGLGVDAENPTGAVKLYESVGMRATDRFELYEKALP